MISARLWTRKCSERLSKSTVVLYPVSSNTSPLHNIHNDAFDQVCSYISNCTSPIILDSGCGTGRSSLLLGELYPSHVVIGIDRSMARLSRNSKFRNGNEHRSFDNDKSLNDDSSNINANIPTVQQAAPNVFLVRAELVDFWRLILQHQQQELGILHIISCCIPIHIRKSHDSRVDGMLIHPFHYCYNSTPTSLPFEATGRDISRNFVIPSCTQVTTIQQEWTDKIMHPSLWNRSKRNDCITKRPSGKDIPLLDQLWTKVSWYRRTDLWA